MARDVAIGLKSLYMGALQSDGDISNTFELVSNAVIDTPLLTIAEGTKTDFEIEDSDDPYYSKTIPGAKTFAASFYGISAAMLAKFFGGVASIGPASGNDTWEAPAQFPTYERSIIAEHSQGGHLIVARASVSATADWAFQKNNLPKINIVATVLSPQKVGVVAFKFNTAPYVP
jgi:hypothetical protein